MAALALASSCGDDSVSDAQRFCGEVEVHRDVLTRPVLRTQADVEAYIELYRDIGQYAPLAIETEWDQLIVNYETARNVIPGGDSAARAQIRSAQIR